MAEGLEHAGLPGTQLVQVAALQCELVERGRRAPPGAYVLHRCHVYLGSGHDGEFLS